VCVCVCVCVCVYVCMCVAGVAARMSHRKKRRATRNRSTVLDQRSSAECQTPHAGTTHNSQRLPHLHRLPTQSLVCYCRRCWAWRRFVQLIVTAVPVHRDLDHHRDRPRVDSHALHHVRVVVVMIIHIVIVTIIVSRGPALLLPRNRVPSPHHHNLSFILLGRLCLNVPTCMH